MKKLGFIVGVIVLLFTILLVIPIFKYRYPHLIQGFATYDCSRDKTCPEGTFCQNNNCIPIAAPSAGGETGFYA